MRGMQGILSLVLAAVVFATITGVATVAWFLDPPRQVPAHSDAVMAIAGAPDGRHQRAAQLVDEGVSQNFVVSNPKGKSDTGVSTAFCRGSHRPARAAQVWCLQPEPVTTVGEALKLQELAGEEGWKSVVLVTNRPHSRRVRTIFERCTDLDVSVTSSEWVDTTRIPYHVLREAAGYAKFWVTRPCG